MTTNNVIHPIIPPDAHAVHSGAVSSTYYTIGPNIKNLNVTSTAYNVSYNSTIIYRNNEKILSIDENGNIVWGQGIKIDKTAEDLANSLALSLELKAGITQKIKLEMRDSVFESLINIAKMQGALTANDLTYLLEASKIVEKLRGAD